MSNETLNRLARGIILRGVYEIKDVLGRGGFAFTYRAYDRKLKRDVAIKEYFPSSLAARSNLLVCPQDQASQQGFKEGLDSFINEARTLARFSNENICAVLDYFQENGTGYMVMPYLLGETLDVILDKCPGSVMSAKAVLVWLPSLLGALKEIHASSFIHRDIKPSNIFIGYDGKPILIDFGAARASLGRTHGYTIVLTPAYAPPEQSTSDIRAQGPWTDIFALGAVIYRCLMGTPPPAAQTRVFAVANGEPDPLDEELNELRSRCGNDALYEVVKKSLALNRRSRIQSVKEFKEVLNTEKKVEHNLQARKNAPSDNTPVYILILAAIAFIFIITLMSQCTKTSNWSALPASGTQQSTAQSANPALKKTQVKPQAPEPTRVVQQQNVPQQAQGVQNYLEEAESDLKKQCYITAAKKFESCLSEPSFNIADKSICANYLAHMNAEGLGPYTRDAKKACELYEYAARNGNQKAQYNVAKYYKNGTGCDKNMSYAVYWYRKAADGNERNIASKAAIMLGYIYETGLNGYEENKREAYTWYKKAYALNSLDKIAADALDRLKKYAKLTGMANSDANDASTITPAKSCPVTDKEFLALCKNGTAEKVREALANGANLNAKDRTHINALMFAAGDNPDPEVVKILLQAGAKINAANKNHWTPLMLAAGYNPNPQVVRILLDFGANVHAKTNSGTTALMAAAQHSSNPEVITMLLRAGADVNAKNNKGQNALWHAQHSKRGKLSLYRSAKVDREIEALLLYAGAQKYTPQSEALHPAWKAPTARG